MKFWHEFLPYVFKMTIFSVDSELGNSLDFATQVYKESDCTSSKLNTEMLAPVLESTVSVTEPELLIHWTVTPVCRMSETAHVSEAVSPCLTSTPVPVIPEECFVRKQFELSRRIKS